MRTVNRTIALYHLGTFYHVSARNADGTPVRARVNGECKTWKRRPDDFRRLVKYGFKWCFYITPANAGEWEVEDDAAERCRQRAARADLCIALMVGHDIPDDVLRDLAQDRGLAADF